MFFRGYQNSIKPYIHAQEVEIINILNNYFCSTLSKIIIYLNYRDQIRRSVTKSFTSTNFTCWQLDLEKIHKRYVTLRLSFFRNILSSIAGNNVKFSDEINLKNHINKMLIFFHLYWLDIKQDIADHSQYLNKISALLNVYIDMELKTSLEARTSHVRDSSRIAAKIAAKILAALYIYLNNSEEHIFRVLLRIKHTTEKYTKVCNYIFTKSFTNFKTKTTSITDVAYIRYLLAFKIWETMEETTKKNLKFKKKLSLSDKKERINKLAPILLGPRMPKLQDELKFVPRPPKDQDNETQWLIQTNLFDTKQILKQFLLFEDKMDNSTGLQCTKTIHVENCSKAQKHQTNLLFQRNISIGGTSEQKIKKCLGFICRRT